MNFSTWGLLDKAQKISMLEQICDECSEGSMPIRGYLWMHPEAILSPEVVESICQWTEKAAMNLLNNL